MPGVVRISVTRGKKTLAVDYFLSRLPSDFGDGFRLEKIVPVAGEPSTYDVNLSTQSRSCECQGFLRHSHCKHAEALAALRDRHLI
jgi:hypothetical protein